MRQFSKNPPPTPSKGGQAWRLSLIVVLALVACKSNSWLNKTNSKLKVDRETTSKSTEVSSANSTILFTRQFSDSNGFDYEVTIFPLDTFRFSPNKGFVGLAGKVTITGHSTQLFKFEDSFSGTNELDKRVAFESASSSQLIFKEDAKVKQKERNMKGIMPVIFIVVLFGGILIYWKIKGPAQRPNI